MHDEVGPPPLQQVEQVMSTVDGAGPKEVTGREAGLLLGRQLADRRVVRHPLIGLGQRDPGTVSGDPEPADQGRHVGAGRDHDVVAALLGRPDQRHHRQQVTVPRPGTKQDPHRRNSSAHQERRVMGVYSHAWGRRSSAWQRVRASKSATAAASSPSQPYRPSRPSCWAC
jgi:hypothetical protein